MKNLSGFSDSLASVSESPAKCEQCGATTRLGNGVCVSCLLREGLDADEQRSTEVFESVLAEVDVPDKQWRLGNYEILEEIGRGGMGVIYRARQRHSRRIVALKRLLSYHADSHETLVRFRREAEAVASLDHPNILPIYEVGESEEGLPYFSMKFATGGSLQQIGPALRSEPRQCVQLMAKVARATEYAHGQGILHRDLKPGNVLLDGRGEPLVCDFGLAKWLDADSDLTRSLTTFGTPGYIAPEQSEGAAADLSPAADIYSLGALLFDLLTGRAPFLGTHALSVIRQAAEKPAPKLRSLARSLDRDLETICARCLERDPKARYRSAGDLAIDLERWLEGRPIVAHPVLAPARIWRWSRRNPKLVATGAACLLFGAAAIWFFRGELVGAPENSIAVLPFENVDHEEKNIVFTELMRDDISSQLSNVAELKVIAGKRVQQYTPGPQRNLREIAKTLGVKYVLEGSVRRVNRRVGMSARFIEARTGSQVWESQYDRDLPQSLGIPSEVAQAIANKLPVKISPAEKAALMEPTDTLSKSVSLWRKATDLATQGSGDQLKENLLQSERLLNEATRLDPNGVRVYRELARTQLALWRCESGEKGATARRRTLAKQALDQVVRLEPDAPETHGSQRMYHYFFLREYDNAVRELILEKGTLSKNAAALLNGAFMERRGGHWEDCLAHFSEAGRLDPNAESIVRETARTFEMLRRYREAEELVQRRLATPSEAEPGFYRQLGEFRLAQGDAHGANEFLARMPEGLRLPENESLARITAALYLRDYNSARQLLAAAPANLIDSPGIMDQTPNLHFWFRAQIDRAQNGALKARETFAAARAETEARWGDREEIPAQLSLLACMDAGAGRKEEAIREAKRALEMRPIAKDAIDGPYLAANLALVYAWSGERDLAIEQLSALARIPAGPSYGDLKLNPKWDDLRGDPRFEQMVESLEPSG